MSDAPCRCPLCAAILAGLADAERRRAERRATLTVVAKGERAGKAA